MAIELSYILESNIKKYKDEKSLQETGIVLSIKKKNFGCLKNGKSLISINTDYLCSRSCLCIF